MSEVQRMSRRGLLRASAVAGAAVVANEALTVFARPRLNGHAPIEQPAVALQPAVRQLNPPYGALQPPDQLGLSLPPGFTARLIATSGQPVPGTSYVWHVAPDGAACFPRIDEEGRVGWTLVSNSERTIASGGGGVSAIDFDADGTIVAARPLLTGSDFNCAGGVTPWGTWLSCEETSRGGVWEVSPTGSPAPVRHTSMGLFRHEAAAVDPRDGTVYLTEDTPNGGLYRFIPSSPPSLAHGVLEVLTLTAGELTWVAVPDPLATVQSTRNQVPNTRRFNGGEGCWFFDGVVNFTTKGDNRVWAYDIAANELTVVYDAAALADPVLTGVDNVVMRPQGDRYIAEDGATLDVVVITVDGRIGVVARLQQSGSTEITGLAFTPAGDRLYFGSQRAPGRIFEVSGPFR